MRFPGCIVFYITVMLGMLCCLSQLYVSASTAPAYMHGAQAGASLTSMLQLVVITNHGAFLLLPTTCSIYKSGLVQVLLKYG